MSQPNKPELQPTTFQKLSDNYGNLSVIRALIQAIPYVGGSLDTLLSDSGQKFKIQRIESLIANISEQLALRVTPKDIVSIQNNEEMYDMLLCAFEESVKTRSEDKRKDFAKIITNQIIKPIEWNKAETLLRLISRLNEIHINILKQALTATPCGKPFEGMKVICLNQEDEKQHEKRGTPPTNISPKFTGIEQSLLKFHCMELISMGLLKDEGIGRLGTNSLSYFIPTEMASFLFEQLES